MSAAAFGAVRRRGFKTDLDLDVVRLGRDLDPVTRARTARLWAARARDEQRAVVGMTQLLADMARDGAPADVIAAGARVVDDETRHVDLCKRIAEAMSPAQRIEHKPPSLPPSSKREVRARVAMQVASLLCVGETLSMAMLAAAREECADPEIERALTHLLADESIHSRFGWWWLDLRAKTLDTAEIALLEGMLRRLLGDLDAALRPKSVAGIALPGAPSGVRQHATFLGTVRDTIVPRFEAHGIRAGMCFALGANVERFEERSNDDFEKPALDRVPAGDRRM